MRSHPLTSAGIVLMSPRQVAQLQPSFQRACAAVRRPGSRPWILRVTGLLELLMRSWRLGEHSLADQPTHHERRHAGG
jgi:hypothetical protein